MRKAAFILTMILVMALVFCGCSGNTEPSESGSSEVNISTYKKPAETVDIDLSKDDPSTDTMRFVFDDEGKVSQCYYMIDDQETYVNYTYKDGCAQIYAFMGDVLVADETIDISEYSADKGFTVIEGYYFKGVSARS